MPSIQELLGRPPQVTNDPAWQPPTDPLKNGTTRAQAGIISREIPLVSTLTNWTFQEVRNALQTLTIGLFDLPAQLVDAITADARVQASLTVRSSGLLGRPITFTLPKKYKDDPEAKKCLRAFRNAWPRMATEASISELQKWSMMMGFGIGQLIWDTSGKYSIPYLHPWNPRYTYYHPTFRKYIAITLDGQYAVEPGDAHWVLHAPHGEYRGWMRGMVRALAGPWYFREQTWRDWARYSEAHGFPILKAISPAAGDDNMIAQFRAACANLGQETVVQIPKGVDGENSYDLQFLEAAAGNWESFQKLIDACNMEITLCLNGQNLTTEVKEGSFAAARVHGDVKQTLMEADARALSSTIYMQIARPFAAVNFGNPNFAPMIEWDVAPEEDYKTKSETFRTITTAVLDLRKGGIGVEDVEDLNGLLEDFGLHLKVKFKDVPPLVTGGLGGTGGGEER